jgi:hypothetical protein
MEKSTVTTPKSLDAKLRKIRANPEADEFILADAKDADMAFGLSAPGKSPEHHAHEGHFRTLQEYRRNIREVIEQGLVDIVLMSTSTSEILTLIERRFEKSHVTPAIRANDTSDIWLAAGSGRYASQPSRPFSTTTLDHAMCGHIDCRPEERQRGADLGLYSITFNNDTELDLHALQIYKEFRIAAERVGFRHFLELFHPNAPGQHPPDDLAQFMVDHIARTLAGVPESSRPVFLKIPYLGPEATEKLARYDRNLIVGILGGSSGTTRDAFQMLADARKYGAKVALYGRKINNAEHQLRFITYLRGIADGKIDAAEAVRAYHGDLQKMGIRPYRPIEEDLVYTQGQQAESGYSPDGSPQRGGKRKLTGNAGIARGVPKRPTPFGGQNGADEPSKNEPDFSKMSPSEKVEWNLKRWERILG